MIIAIAGKYSAPTVEERNANLAKLNAAAALLLQKGHIPIVGVNAALPVVTRAGLSETHKAIMDISMTVMQCCEGLLLLSESPGAMREHDFIKSKGLPIFYSIDEILSDSDATKSNNL